MYFHKTGYSEKNKYMQRMHCFIHECSCFYLATLISENILAYWTEFSAIFTIIDKSYLTLIQPVGQIKKMNNKSQYIGCIGGHITVVKTLGVDTIATSHSDIGRQLTIWRTSMYRNVTH